MPVAETGGRYALVCPNYYPVTCGVGDHSMRLANELARDGATVKVFTQAPARPNPDWLGVEVHGAPGRTPLEVVDALKHAISAFDPTDLVVQYTPNMLGASRFGTFAIPALMAPFRGRARITVVFHELNYPWTWRPDLAIGGIVQRIQFMATVALADRLFVTTRRRQQELERQLTAGGLTCTVGTLFVGGNAEPRLPRASRKPRLGIFSKMGPHRRFDLAVEAFSAIRADYPNAELVFIGDLGDPSSRGLAALYEQIQRSPAASGIRVTGKLPLSRVAEEIAALDIYWFADEGGVSTRSGTLPVAFGCGVPVIGIRGPETDDTTFVPDENLIYLPELTAASLANAALRLIRDPSLAEKIGSGGRRLWEHQLAWPAIAKRFLAS